MTDQPAPAHQHQWRLERIPFGGGNVYACRSCLATTDHTDTPEDATIPREPTKHDNIGD